MTYGQRFVLIEERSLADHPAAESPGG